MVAGMLIFLLVRTVVSAQSRPVDVDWLVPIGQLLVTCVHDKQSDSRSKGAYVIGFEGNQVADGALNLIAQKYHGLGGTWGTDVAAPLQAFD